MPFIHVRIAGPTLAPEQTQRLQKDVTALMATVLRKKPELTAVLVEQAPIAAWSVGGASPPVAAHLDAKVTAGTNTTEEKASFVAAANSLLKSVLGAELPLATYVVVHELPGSDWGYNGETQAHRAASANQRISAVLPSI